MVVFTSVAPVLPVSSLSEAARRYELLGFTVRLFEGGDYAFATRDDVSLHLATVERVTPASSTVAVYLYVSDAQALHASGLMPVSTVVTSHPSTPTTGSSKGPTSTPTATC